MPPYEAAYPKGCWVRVASREVLEQFAATWDLHAPLQAEQLAHAGKLATVKWLGYYHGGGALYWLRDVRGVWHECCLRPVEDERAQTQR